MIIIHNFLFQHNSLYKGHSKPTLNWVKAICVLLETQCKNSHVIYKGWKLRFSATFMALRIKWIPGSNGGWKKGLFGNFFFAFRLRDWLVFISSNVSIRYWGVLNLVIQYSFFSLLLSVAFHYQLYQRLLRGNARPT